MQEGSGRRLAVPVCVCNGDAHLHAGAIVSCSSDQISAVQCPESLCALVIGHLHAGARTCMQEQGLPDTAGAALVQRCSPCSEDQGRPLT
jgi:hypothetical protein